MKPLITGDKQITFFREAFSRIGNVRVLPATAIYNRAVTRTDILLVRSVTKVNQELLHGTKIKFVGTLTSGFDHVERTYLKQHGIKFAYAPGSNANAVAEYVIASLLHLARVKNISLSGKTIGIIGVGHVGRLVVEKCTALGMHVLMNDPPLRSKTDNHKFVSLKKIFSADIITLHVPLTYRGIYATYHMVDENFLARMKKGVFLINTSRGSVVDETALLKHRSRLGAVVFDVWENEPNINPGTAAIVDIGTPHIAGYALDAKVRATAMIQARLARYLGVEDPWTPVSLLKLPAHRTVKIPCQYRSDEEIIGQAVLGIYDPEKDYMQLRKLLKLPARSIGRQFQHLRNSYGVRREFCNYKLLLTVCTPLLRSKLENLGFTDIKG